MSTDVLSIEDVDFFLDGNGVHAGDLFRVYDPLEQALESNHRRNQKTNQYKSVMGHKEASEKQKAREENRKKVQEAERRFAQEKAEFEAYAEIDGETYSVVPRQNIPTEGILSRPNVMFLKSEDSGDELVLRHWRPLDDETLSRLHQNTSFNRMKHDDEFHRSIGEDPMKEFNESMTMIDERDLQTALMCYYDDVRDNPVARPITPTKWTAVDMNQDGGVYVIRDNLEHVYKGGLSDGDAQGLANWYANLANLQVVNWFDRKDEFFVDSWKDGNGRFPVFIDNEFSGAVKSKQHFLGGEDYQNFPDTLKSTLTENHDYPEPVAQQIADEWKEAYAMAQNQIDELPDEDIIDYLENGWDPDILPYERRVTTRL